MEALVEILGAIAELVVGFLDVWTVPLVDHFPDENKGEEKYEGIEAEEQRSEEMV